VDQCPREAGLAVNFGCPAPVTTEEPPTPDDTGNNNPTPETPSSVAPPPTEEPTPAPTLAPMPIDGACVVSPLGLFNVNVRDFPYDDATVITILAINELAPVIAVTQILGYYAEPEWVSENYVWYQIEHNGFIGWVAANVVRLGGDCSDFDIPEVFQADDVLNPLSLPLPASFAGGVNVAVGDLNGDGQTEGKEHKEWIIIESVSLIPFRPADQTAGVLLDIIEGRVLVNDDNGEPLVDIITGSGAGGNPTSQSAPRELDVVVCANIANPDAPLTDDDCVIITSAGGAKADILIEAATTTIFCFERDGVLICETTTPSATDLGNCTPVGNTFFCATDFLPSEACWYDTDDGHLICTGFSQIAVLPMNPTSPLPGLTLLHPEDEPILIGLLLPAVQKVR
ncbi:MAG TPA: SH3 domain-containing protein, partial [Aggregatilineales bacterium]|nr:SH3 domain-containing protein [Aggregatilineales bacterium]